jgi:hypothetical protein
MHAYLISEVRCRVNYSNEILRGGTRKIEGMGIDRPITVKAKKTS